MSNTANNTDEMAEGVALRVPNEEVRDIVIKDTYTLDGETFTSYMSRMMFQHEVLRTYLQSLQETIQSHHLNNIMYGGAPTTAMIPGSTLDVIETGLQATATVVQKMEMELFDMRDKLKRVVEPDTDSQPAGPKRGNELTIEALRAELDRPRFVILQSILLAITVCYVVWRCEILLSRAIALL